jgi:hypothetical protein
MSVTAILNTLPTAADGNVDVPTDELDRALQNLEVKQRKPRKTKQKDPNAPKRPASAYMLWLNENRSSIKDELLTTNPDAKITDVTKRAGELWKELTDDEKAPHQKASEALREKYHEAMKVYKPDHTVAKKSKAVKYDADEILDAPEGWSGPFAMKYLYRKVKDAEGKHVRIQKSFTDAVALANAIIQAWNDAKDSDSLPDHWKSDVTPCAGITKTSTGYDLRLGPDLMTTADKDSKGGIASWLVGEHELPTVDDNEQPVVEKPVVEEKPAPKKRGRKAKQTQPVVDDSNESSSPEAAAAPAPAPKKTTKIIKKVVKKKTPEPQPINPDDCQEIEIERDGTEVTLLLHEQTQMVYDTDNLLHPIGKVDDDGIEFF